MNAAANALESTMRKGAEGQAHIATDVANPASNPEKYADPSGEKMKALAWQGANDVQMGQSLWFSKYFFFTDKKTQSTPSNRKLSMTKMSSSKSQVQPSVVVTYISIMVPSSKCKRVIYLATNSAAKSTRWDQQLRKLNPEIVLSRRSKLHVANAFTANKSCPLNASAPTVTNSRTTSMATAQQEFSVTLI